MAENVLMDAQFEFMRVAQPLSNFEAVYQGLSGSTPIAFPGAPDPHSGKSGYAANLLSGMKMPALGARVKIWIPMTLYPNIISEGELIPAYNYEYQLQWRLRNQNDFADDATNGVLPAMPFSLPTQELGYQNSSSKRYFFPCGTDVLLYEQSEPGSDGLPGTIIVRGQRYRPSISTTDLPVTATGIAAVWQQGTYQDASVFPDSGGASYMILDVEVQGNELSIWAFKIATGEGHDWDFAVGGEDHSFSFTYGTANGSRAADPNVGILVTAGNASP